MQTKFKKGDRVVVAKGCAGGQTGVIDEDLIDDFPFVLWDAGGRSPIHVDAIELITEPTPTRLESELKRERLIRHLFVGIVAETIGIEKTYAMLKEAIEAINALNEKQ